VSSGTFSSIESRDINIDDRRTSAKEFKEGLGELLRNPEFGCVGQNLKINSVQVGIRDEARHTTRMLGKIKIIVYEDEQELIADAANELFNLLRVKPNAVLGLATGGTFEPFYAYVTSHYRDNGVSFREATAFNLDEYVGIPESDEQSYYHYMWANLYSKIDMKRKNVFIPNGNARNLEEEKRNYERMIKERGGIDLQYLGIGRNGHIGFNEPYTPFSSKTHVVGLTESTLEANSKYFVGRNMPTRAITVGIGTIIDARRIILIATGDSKRSIIDRVLKSGETEEIPATALMHHRDTTIMLDSKAGASLL